MNLPDLLTVEQLAAYLGKRPAAVRSLAHRGQIAFIRCGRAMRFREDDVTRFIDTNRRPALGESALDDTRHGTRHQASAARL